MSEMVERVAVALARKHYADRFNKDANSDHVNLNVSNNWHLFMADARTAIKAMREPTEEMCDAPADAGNIHRARAIWTAMIDSILNEEGK